MRISSKITVHVGDGAASLPVSISAAAVDHMAGDLGDPSDVLAEFAPMITTIVMGKVATGHDPADEVEVSLADVSAFPLFDRA